MHCHNAKFNHLKCCITSSSSPGGGCFSKPSTAQRKVDSRSSALYLASISTPSSHKHQMSTSCRATDTILFSIYQCRKGSQSWRRWPRMSAVTTCSCCCKHDRTITKQHMQVTPSTQQLKPAPSKPQSGHHQRVQVTAVSRAVRDSYIQSASASAVIILKWRTTCQHGSFLHSQCGPNRDASSPQADDDSSDAAVVSTDGGKMLNSPTSCL